MDETRYRNGQFDGAHRDADGNATPSVSPGGRAGCLGLAALTLAGIIGIFWLVRTGPTSLAGTAHPRFLLVSAGPITGDRIVIKDGIEGGQAIAMSGVHLLTEGMEVTELTESDETRK